MGCGNNKALKGTQSRETLITHNMLINCHQSRRIQILTSIREDLPEIKKEKDFENIKIKHYITLNSNYISQEIYCVIQLQNLKKVESEFRDRKFVLKLGEFKSSCLMERTSQIRRRSSKRNKNDLGTAIFFQLCHLNLLSPFSLA